MAENSGQETWAMHGESQSSPSAVPAMPMPGLDALGSSIPREISALRPNMHSNASLLYNSTSGGNRDLVSNAAKASEKSHMSFLWKTISNCNITQAYRLCAWLRHNFTLKIAAPFSRFFDRFANGSDAAAKKFNDNRGEWDVVIHEPRQAQYAPTLVGLPAEITDIVMTFCETIPQNNTLDFNVDYVFEDRLRRDGVRRIISGPNMLGLAHTNRQLRYFQMMHMFRGRVLCLRHEDVTKTVEFLAELYPSARNGIRGLHIEWQRTKPVDHMAFQRLCGIMNNMPKLEILHMLIPINGRPLYQARPSPGLWNGLLWLKDKIIRDAIHISEAMRGFGFSTSRQAGWIQHILSVRGARIAGRGGIRDFRLETYPRAEGFGLRTWLENQMTLEWDDKVATVERIICERSWLARAFQ